MYVTLKPLFKQKTKMDEDPPQKPEKLDEEVDRKAEDSLTRLFQSISQGENPVAATNAAPSAGANVMGQIMNASFTLSREMKRQKIESNNPLGVFDILFGKSADICMTLEVTLEQAALGEALDVRMPGDQSFVEVKLPRGCSHRQQIVVKGVGVDKGDFQPRGDLVVTVEHKPHAKFVVCGDSLSMEVPFTLRDVYRGFTLNVRSLTGTWFKIDLPPDHLLTTRSFPGRGFTEEGRLFVKKILRLPETAEEAAGSLAN